MIDLLKYIFALVVSYIMAIPHIAVMCVGLYSLFLTFVSTVAKNNDNVLKIGYGVSSIACLFGALYGYIAETYCPIFVGPIILLSVYGYHRGTYG
jgi:hypothetical protein